MVSQILASSLLVLTVEILTGSTTEAADIHTREVTEAADIHTRQVREADSQDTSVLFPDTEEEGTDTIDQLAERVLNVGANSLDAFKETFKNGFQVNTCFFN